MLLESSIMLLESSIMLLESSIMLLESSIMLLESSIILQEHINSAGVNHDEQHLRSSNFYRTGHWLELVLKLFSYLSNADSSAGQ
jgi:hypothetical protein